MINLIHGYFKEVNNRGWVGFFCLNDIEPVLKEVSIRRKVGFIAKYWESIHDGFISTLLGKDHTSFSRPV